MASPPVANSQTAQDFIASQLSLEADAREALPYQFDTCTKPLGPLRQSVYACLTCTPPPASPHQQFTPAGLCYSCSISCHGEHNLVELFAKRNFVCDCGTTRLSNSGTPCELRINAATGQKGGILGEAAASTNNYNQNFQGLFCGCSDTYDPEVEKGTMFQCLGLGNVDQGGCGEDWWHPECLLGLPRTQNEIKKENGRLETVEEEPEVAAEHEVQAEHPLPPGFPDEDDFDHLICYKCVGAFPWTKPYAGTTGFLTANADQSIDAAAHGKVDCQTSKRKAEDDIEDTQDAKKVKADMDGAMSVANGTDTATKTEVSDSPTISPKHSRLPPAQSGKASLFLQEDFRDHLCRCKDCFPLLARHPPLLEEEETYEPPVSEGSEAGDNINDAASIGRGSMHSGSLLERGEAALSSMDRVRAIEGVMAYNHVRDKVRSFSLPLQKVDAQYLLRRSSRTLPNCAVMSRRYVRRQPTVLLPTGLAVTIDESKEVIEGVNVR